MNHRRGLRVSTDSALALFALMTIGVVLWTADEVLGWNILPDWIDAYARLLVIILSVLAGFAVIISVMCSFAVLAEAAAEHAHVPQPAISRRARFFVVVGVLASLTIMVVLHRIDQHREAKRVASQREEHRQRYFKDQATLQSRIPGIVAGFTPELLGHLRAPPGGPGEAELTRMLKAIQASTPLAPRVTVMVPAAPPYTHQILSVLEAPVRRGDGTLSFLLREDLLDLPSVWERDTVAALFAGRELKVPHGRSGAFIDTRRPCAWGLIHTSDGVGAIVMLRAP